LARSSIDLTNYDQNEFGFVPVQWAEHEDYYPFNGGQVRVANMDERHAMMDHENLDILVAHHPHVLQGVELYNNKLIVHSLGNFIFDGNFPETMESAIFYSTIDLVDGVPTFTEYKFKPIYLDHYITKPAIGELGAHILDRHANLSRNIGSDYRAYLSVNKINLESKVIISDDPANTLRQQYICSWGLSNPVSVEDPWEGGGSSGTHLYQYDLIRLPRHGNISALGGNIPSGQTFFKYRVGREILPMGNMEDEGSDLWMLNSNYEEYSDEESYRGSRSLKHIRYDEQEGFVLTSFEKRFPIGTFVSSHDAYISWEAKSHSLHGAVKCYNCPPSDPPAFEIIYYQCRNGIPLDYVNEDTYYSETINSELIGDTGWTVIEKELDLQTAEGLMAIPEGNKAFNGMYFNLRIKTWANTGNGDSTVYYDDVGIIEWEDWVVYEDENSLQIQNPNDYKYLQVRTSESASGESIVVEELYYGENLGYSDLDPSPCSGACNCVYYNELEG